LLVEEGEECEVNNQCGPDQSCTACQCVDISPPPTGPVCGNLIVEPPEECEQDDDCGQDEECTDCSCVALPLGPQCGNLIVEPPEECELDEHCDQGEECNDCLCEAVPPAGPICGNLIKEAGEECEIDSDCGDPILECNLCGCYSTVECSNYLLDCYFDLGPDYHCRSEGYGGKCYPNFYITSTEPCLNIYTATSSDGDRTRQMVTGSCSHIPCVNCNDRFGPPTMTCMPDLLVCLECYSDLDCDSSYICKDYQCVDRECSWDEDCDPLYRCEDFRCMPKPV
jgi:hypothetical protein